MFTAASLGMGGYMSYAGGRIRHREFRNEPPPEHAAATRQGTPAVQPGRSAAPASARITIQGLKNSPETVEIKKGETVEWENNDLTPHTVTSRNGEFDSGSIEADASWSHTFEQAGTFPYYCTYHPEMKGTIVVK